MKLIVISSPAPVPNEHDIINSLFEKGLEIFHLHKPSFSKEEIENFIQQISSKYHNRVALHSDFPKFHSLQEFEMYKEKYEYAFLSPIFDSISKQGYKSKFDSRILQKFSKLLKYRNTIALGGIDEDKIETTRELGFAGVAVLGTIWNSKNPVEKFKRIQKQIMILNSKRPTVLSIAGFDPSGGAGVLADIKTFEQHKVLGMGVVTGLTFQNDSEFDGVKWIETHEIIKQIEILSRKFKFDYVKIGMIKNLETLEKIVAGCRLQVVGCKIIWDTIMKASAGFEIHKGFEKEKLISILKNIFLIMPNTDEIKILSGENDEMKGANELSRHCNVFLKGGHSEKKEGYDYLFTTEGKVFPFRPKKISEIGKHGSGCVLSSAITANLAKGENLQRSCLKGKDYVTKFLMSNKTLIGYHKI